MAEQRSLRRRRPHLLATLVLLLAPLTVAAAAYLTFVAEEDSRGSPAFPLAAGTPPARGRARAAARAR